MNTGNAARRVSLRVTTILLTLLMCEQARAQLPESVVTLDVRPGATVNLLLIQPEKPVASLILFAGGSGYLKIREDGIRKLSNNFLVRTRQQFAEHGFTVAVMDSPSDHKRLDDVRDTEWHAQDVGKVINHLRTLSKAPVWLVGTSRGTLSAANAAARLPRSKGGADGLVLSSSVSERGGQRPACLCDIDLKKITVPTLFLHHREDDCSVTPFQETRALFDKLRNAPAREFIGLTGGLPAQSRACGALSAHGFLGIEQQAVSAIATWIRKH